MEGFRSYPSPSGDIGELKDEHRRTIQERRNEQYDAQKRRWKTRRWITFICAVAGAALFIAGLNLAVDWPGVTTGPEMDVNREVVTLDDVQRDASSDSSSSEFSSSESSATAPASPPPSGDAGSGGQ